jgi:hypothetical protein
MAVEHGYCTLAELKAELRLKPADLADDARLEAVISDVSRAIDNECGRRFYTTAADETRHATASHPDHLLLPFDLLALTELATDDGTRQYATVWAASDYDLEPYDAPLDGVPYDTIAVAPRSARAFPAGLARGVRLTGKFGYSADTPGPVRRACLIQCTRIFRRSDAPFGVTGSAEMGTASLIVRLDPDVKLLLAPYKRWTAA